MEAPEVRYVRSGDVNIAYATIGDGPFDIVFVAGWVLTVFESAWDGPAADTLRRLASFARLILFDKRGTGLSDREYGMPDYETRMDDIRAVMDAAGSERAAILGVSEGGPLTLLFAASHPERVAAMILYATTSTFIGDDDHPWSPTAEEWRAIIDGRAQAPFGTDQFFEDTFRGLSPSIADDPEQQRWCPPGSAAHQQQAGRPASPVIDQRADARPAPHPRHRLGLRVRKVHRRPHPRRAPHRAARGGSRL